MLETFFLIYGVMIVAGSWLMLTGVAEAPVGYEDEDGFHYVPVRVDDEQYHTVEDR
ncbi:hypothetical protein [Pelagicoccus sp. SDUM812002]|uniref:hypothetical protein n=1 Tax=Pelagicoccus sp. SDUM812002 TaxID=3041266 RepID=UPI00280E2E52|nr:hypothetical protein [Pelagicoccus sp. SDUM812002]MDQ8185309.1 hypothetical protein [Pelagicoccus sp. SDUM812002]